MKWQEKLIAIILFLMVIGLTYIVIAYPNPYRGQQVPPYYTPYPLTDYYG